MSSQLKSLLWLRMKIIFSNKAMLFVCVLTPILDFYILQAIPALRGNIFFLNLGLSLIYSLTAGTFTSMMVSEEKEKKLIRTLLLGGITSGEYFISVILVPLLTSTISCLLLPFIFGIDLGNWTLYIFISFLTSLAFILINFSVALWSKTQSQSSIYSLLVLLVVTVVSMLAADFPIINKVSQLLFSGANIEYLSHLDEYSLFSLTSATLIIWIVFLSWLTITLFNRTQRA